MQGLRDLRQTPRFLQAHLREQHGLRTCIQRLAKFAKAFAVVEMSTGQLLDDVRLALEGRLPVEFFSRVGGNAPSAEDVLAFIERLWAPAAHRIEEIPEEMIIHG